MWLCAILLNVVICIVGFVVVSLYFGYYVVMIVHAVVYHVVNVVVVV